MAIQKNRILIIGASRGLGLGLVREYLTRGWDVIATVRSDKGEAAVRAVGKELGHAPRIVRLEVNSQSERAALRKELDGTQLDVLFFNAGVNGRHRDEPIEALTPEDFNRIMGTNVFSALHVAAALRELVVPGGTIAFMSSRLGSVSLNDGRGWETYRASKSALNQLVKSFQIRHADDGRTYVLVAPGWVRTDMGGPEAPLDVETSIRGVADMLAARKGSRGIVYANHMNEDVPW